MTFTKKSIKDSVLKDLKKPKSVAEIAKSLWKAGVGQTQHNYGATYGYIIPSVSQAISILLQEKKVSISLLKGPRGGKVYEKTKNL